MTSNHSPDSPTRTLSDAAKIGLMHVAHGDALFIPEATPFSRDKSPALLSMPSPITSDSNSSTPLTSSPKSMSSTFEDSAGQWHRSRHSSCANSTSDPCHQNVLLDDEAYFQLSEYLVQSSDNNDRLSPNEPPLNMDGLQIRVIGAPDKSRVETQTRLCIQLLTSNGTKVSSWPYLKLPEHLLARSRLKRSAQQRSASTSATADGTGRILLSDESKVIYLDARVVCASQPDQPVKVCSGCIQRERKRAERSKNGANHHKNSSSDRRLIIDDIPEQDRILLFNCGPMVNFSSGDAILPTRITCYCRHHNEKVGFCVEFTMKTDKGDTIATGMSPPILITDDHKSTRQKGRKRDRSDYEGSSSTISKSRRLPSSSTAPVTPAASRRGSLSPTEAVSPLLADPAELSILDSAPFSSSLPTPSEERAAFGSNTPFFFPPTSPALNPLDHVNYVAPESLSTPTLERLVPAQGPTYGGVEVTILGSGFYRGLTCLFGEHHAATVYWNPNTLVCVLPPAAHPGPVVVSFKQHSLVLEGQDVPLFTYYDANDQALLELALQVVGLKTTGKLHDAKHIAMRIVQGGDHNPFLLQNSLSGGTNDDEHVISFQQKVIHALDYFHVTAKELIQARLSTGHTLLHLATWIGYDKLASKIIDLCHESIFSTDRNGYTALALAQFAMAEDKRRNRRQVKNIMQCQSLSEDCILRNDIHTKPQEKCKPVTNFHNYSLCWLPLTI